MPERLLQLVGVFSTLFLASCEKLPCCSCIDTAVPLLRLSAPRKIANQSPARRKQGTVTKSKRTELSGWTSICGSCNFCKDLLSLRALQKRIAELFLVYENRRNDKDDRNLELSGLKNANAKRRVF